MPVYRVPRRTIWQKRKLRMRRARRNLKKRGLQPKGVYPFKRWADLGTFTAAADGSDTIRSFTFNLQQLPDYGDFTNLYDMFKINMVKVSAYPMFTSAPAPSGFTTNSAGVTGTFNPTFTLGANTFIGALRSFSCMDYNGNPPTTINEMRQYQNCKAQRYTKTIDG